MKDKLSFPAFTHDSIAGYCNGSPLYAQYKNDKKSKYIGTKQMWQELSKLRRDLEIARKGLEYIFGYENVPKYVVKHISQVLDQIKNETTIEQIEYKE